MNITEMQAAVPKVENPPIRGDPGARRIGLVLFMVLIVVTIGAALGIGLGNLAHARYFSSMNQADVLNQFPDNVALLNQTLKDADFQEMSPKMRGLLSGSNKPGD